MQTDAKYFICVLVSCTLTFIFTVLRCSQSGISCLDDSIIRTPLPKVCMVSGFLISCPDVHAHRQRMPGSLSYISCRRDMSGEGVIEIADCAENAIIKIDAPCSLQADL